MPYQPNMTRVARELSETSESTSNSGCIGAILGIFFAGAVAYLAHLMGMFS